jgi:hypothetical protein
VTMRANDTYRRVSVDPQRTNTRIVTAADRAAISRVLKNRSRTSAKFLRPSRVHFCRIRSCHLLPADRTAVSLAYHSTAVRPEAPEHSAAVGVRGLWRVKNSHPGPAQIPALARVKS